MLEVVENPVQNRFAAADVIGNVFDVSRAADTGRDIEARDLDANAMAALEGIGRCRRPSGSDSTCAAGSG